MGVCEEQDANDLSNEKAHVLRHVTRLTLARCKAVSASSLCLSWCCCLSVFPAALLGLAAFAWPSLRLQAFPFAPRCMSPTPCLPSACHTAVLCHCLSLSLSDFVLARMFIYVFILVFPLPLPRLPVALALRHAHVHPSAGES